MAPTGSGKTEAALLPILHRLLEDKEKAERRGELWPSGVHVLYVTSLRALCSDIAERLDRYVREVLGFYCSAKAWHSDVKKDEKTLMEEHPPTILVTTPESLEAMLDTGKEICASLKNLKCVIIDEVHELSESKRGHQLLILLERLKHTLRIPRLQRVAISATVANPARIAKMFGGSDGPLEVVYYPRMRRMRVKVIFHQSVDEEEVAKDISSLVESEKSLIFVNTRAEAEGVHASSEELGVRNYGVHHSSLSSNVRRRVEKEFKEGKLNAIVCTRTLELGIDIGSVRRVVQVGSPSLPEALAQRFGRSAHKPGEEAQGVILCLETADILEVLALTSMLSRGRLAAEVKLPVCIDVAARTLTAIALQNKRSGSSTLSVKEALRLITLAIPYSDVNEGSLMEALQELMKRKVMNVGADGTLSLGEFFDKVWRGKYFASSFSMIPEKESLVVKHWSEKIGEIDPVNLRYIRRGAVIRLAGRNWRVVGIGRDIYVEEAKSERYTVPIWKGGYIMTPRAVCLETYRILSKLLAGWESSRLWGPGGTISFGNRVVLEFEEGAAGGLKRS